MGVGNVMDAYLAGRGAGFIRFILHNISTGYMAGEEMDVRVCLQTSYRSQISEAARHTKAAKTSASLS